MLKTAVFCFRGAISFYKAIVLRAYANSPRTRCRVSSPKGRAFLRLTTIALIPQGRTAFARSIYRTDTKKGSLAD